MSADLPPPTIADVLHEMYLATDDPYRFPGALAALLGMEIEDLRTLYDQPAPDPTSPAFAEEVRAVAALARCDPAVLAELLRAWTPAPGLPGA